MIIIGYLAMLFLGLLPLAAVARIAGVESDRVFFFPAEFALIVAFLVGASTCMGVGRVLGVLQFGELNSYQQRNQARSTTDAIRSGRRRHRRAVRGLR
jgi:hypothetical protein